MTFPSNNVIQFVGHFHPVLVHLPIGSLILLGALEILAFKWKDVARNNRWILGFAMVTVFVSAACGWMLAQSGGYDRQLLNWHRGLGIGVAAGCLITFGLLRWGSVAAYRVSLATTLGLLVIVGHLGGSITHGRDFLTRYAPKPARGLLGAAGASVDGAPLPFADSKEPIFAAVVSPILQQHCWSCHGPDKHKADLRLDSYEALRKGGQDGPVIKPGDSKNSPLIQCIVSGEDADGHMPPEGQLQPTAGQIAILKWWIEIGAPSAPSLDGLHPKPEMEPQFKVSQPPSSAQN